ncbi:MAG: protein GrpE [Planctomycetota bacterium]|nr:MAG: protein GrpE [Planctomycetota bacterium]
MASTSPESPDSLPSDETVDDDAARAGADQGAGDNADDTAAPEPDAEQRAKEFEDRWLRAKAELENSRKRQRQDLDEARRFGAVPLLASLLNAVDTLQRAIEEASKNASDDDPLIQGLQLTEQQFLMALQDHGVSPLETEVGAPLDPAQHRALLEQPSADQAPGTILSVFQKGYMLHDRLLREAQVVVAKAVDQTPVAEDGDADV